VNRAQKRSQWRESFRGQARASERTRPGQSVPTADARAPLTNPPSQSHSTIHLRVEELVLRGFDKRDAPRIATAIEAELTQLIAARGVPSNWQRNLSAGQIHADPARIPSRSNPRWTGEQIARAIYSGPSREHR